jgi:hypothetical protein
MQPNAILAWPNFIMQKVGVTNLPPLKGISPSRFGGTGKKFWVNCSELFFMLPCSFIFGVVTPLYFAHLDDLIVSHSLCSIQIVGASQREPSHGQNTGLSLASSRLTSASPLHPWDPWPERALGRVLKNLPSLDWGGGGGACCCCSYCGLGCRCWRVCNTSYISWFWLAMSCSIWGLAWLLVLLPWPLPLFIVFTI